MSHHEEKNQAAKVKTKQNEVRPQNQQGKQQPGNRPQNQQGSLREDSAQIRANENERSKGQNWSSQNDRHNYDR